MVINGVYRMGSWELIFTAACIMFWGLAYLGAPIWVWSVTAVLSLAIVQWMIPDFSLCYLVLWITLGLCIPVLNFPVIRRKILTQFLFRWFQKAIPQMSITEREAIEAGNSGWESVLFQGRLDWCALHRFPKPALAIEELHFINHQVEQLCEKVDEWSITHVNLDLPPEVWSYLKEEGFFGMIIPKEYGGLGFSSLANSTIVQKIASRSLTTAVTVMVPNSLGPGELLISYGTEAQKRYYLPRLAKGIDIPCFALTALEAGSDAGAISDHGIVCYGEFEGKTILGMKLTWNKRYITLAPVATILGLAFKLYDPEKLLGEEETLGITVCLLPTSHEGVEIGKRHFPLNQAFMNGPTRGNEVFVPLDWIIGGPKMAGKGWKMLMECLSAGRGISLPALSTAAAKMSYRTTGAYARIRKQFNNSIGRFEGVQAPMARIAGLTYIIEAARLFTLTGLAQHHRPAVTTAIAKYHMTEMARQVVNHAMDIHGGKAIMLGPRNYLARVYESMPISITVEGANILTRNLIIFGQGVIRCHPYIQQEMAAASDPNVSRGLENFDRNLFKHLRYSLSNCIRTLTHSLTAGLCCSAPLTSSFSKYYRQLSRMSIALSFIADATLMMLGGKLKRCERLSARLGDMLSYLYLGTAVLKYYQDVGDKKSDSIYVHWALQICLYHIQEAFLKFSRNFPIPLVGLLFRCWVFPYGRAYGLPSDALERQMALSMMQPSLFRDRLTRYCYLSSKEDNPITQLEQALNNMIAEEAIMTKVDHFIKKKNISTSLPIKEKIQKALEDGILTLEEADLIYQFEKTRLEVMQVDEFSEEQLNRN
jgi:acyl-CoA dehydrogenase